MDGRSFDETATDGTFAARASLAVTLAGFLVSPLSAAAQDFEWRGTFDEGDDIQVHGVIGDIEAVPASGGQVVVTADLRQGRRGSAEDVEIEVVEDDRGATICAVYPSRPGRAEHRCRRGDSRLGNHRNDTRVEFRVEVPDGVNLVARTVNGRVDVRGVAGDVDASTVNGDIEAEAGGSVDASTVNGSIRASMERDLARDVTFESVNGSLTITLPAGANADVEANTVNGSLDSDFPLTVRGRFSNRSMRGTIGDGGRGLRLKTVNGSIAIRRS